MQEDLTRAMKEGDRALVTVLRTALAAVANAEAVDPSGPRSATGLGGDVERRLLAERDIEEIVVAERDELRADGEAMRRLGRDEGVALEAQAALLDRYLPCSGRR